MKKLAITLLVLLLPCLAMAWTFSPGTAIDGYPGVAGVQGVAAGDNDTITWTIADKAAVGAYFFIKFTDGDATSSSIKFYTSQLSSGDTDWTVYAPRDNTTFLPTDYSVGMPTVSKVWFEPIPFPIYIKRVRAIYTISSDGATDTVIIKMLTANR